MGSRNPGAAASSTESLVAKPSQWGDMVGAGETAPGEFIDGAQGMAMAGESEFGFLADDTRAVALAMALRWTWTTQTHLLNLLRAMGSRSAQTAKAFTGEQIKGAWARLKQVSLLLEPTHRPGYVRLTDPLRIALYREILDKVPASAQDELQNALRALTGHFDVKSDHAAAREEAARTQLRAELSPAGDGLLLRLVAAPLGADGPRLMPGQGRERVMAAIGGESVGTRRDPTAEQAHLDTVIERLPFLTAPRRGDSVCEWVVDDPELALAMVEALPPRAAIAAVEIDKAGIKAPNLASAWLDETLDGIAVETDKAFRQRVERLRAAQDIRPAVPGGLQAELRPHQEDGYQ